MSFLSRCCSNGIAFCIRQSVTYSNCRGKAQENYGPIMVQQLFLSAPITLQVAIRVACFLLVTSKRLTVTALLVILGA
jgi:hypothetical protein